MRRGGIGRRGPSLVRAVAGTAVIAGTAGAVHHRQDQRWANKAAEEQAKIDGQQALADADQMEQQLAAQQAQIAAQQAQMAQMAAMQQPAPVAAAPVAVAPAAAGGSTDRIAKLKELAELKQAGILTDAEFEAEKAKILAGG
jgi:hypothetical protein